MKKLLLFLTLGLTYFSIQAQTYKQKLYYTCKVWGFIKYYHSRVSIGAVNWDSVLLHCLPLVKAAVTKNDFNNTLDTMLNAAGTMALTSSPPCDTMPPELKRNLNFGWIGDTMLRSDVQTILDTIKNNFRPHSEYWVQNNTYSNSNRSWLIFPYDSLMVNADLSSNYPDEWHRVLLLCKEWNIVNYFAFNDYIDNQSWDSTLSQNVISFDTASNDPNFFKALSKLTSNLDDSHTGGWTYDLDGTFPFGGAYEIQLILKYIPNKYVVVESNVTGISPGDQILAINGLTTKQWEDSLKPYVSTSDTASFRNGICSIMLSGANNAAIPVTYVDSLNNTHTITAYSNLSYYNGWFYSYFPNDTLASTHWSYWNNCNIGYVNVGNIQVSDVTTLYSQLQSTNAIIFDVRNYPSSNALPNLAALMLPNSTQVAKYTLPNVDYPGTWTWSEASLGTNGNPSAYYGNVIILFNDATGSAAEYDCMMLGAMPYSVKVGSQTQGADGDVTYYQISQNMGSGFTTLGWFYPNGDSTQRIGIRPDTITYPTQVGIRHHRDELLEKAMSIASCPLSIPTIRDTKPSVSIYPNPSGGVFNLSISNEELGIKNTVEIYNALGQKVYTASLSPSFGGTSVTTVSLPNGEGQGGAASGIYLYRVLSETGSLIGEGKLIVQH